MVRTLLYDTKNLNVPSLVHGKANEDKARQLENKSGIKVELCELFIDCNLQYLGATPDGLVDEETIVEIKCPVSAFNMDVKVAIEQKKIRFWKIDKKTDSLIINKTHSWFYQIQGQLHTTGRKICILGVWTGNNKDMKVEYIERDDQFWKSEMESQLSN